MRYANKHDANQGPIVEFLRKHGYQVRVMEPPAPYDLKVWRNGFPIWVLLEIKTRLGRLTPEQEKFWSDTEGMPREIARTPEEALKAVEKWI